MTDQRHIDIPSGHFRARCAVKFDYTDHEEHNIDAPDIGIGTPLDLVHRLFLCSLRFKGLLKFFFPLLLVAAAIPDFLGLRIVADL